MVSAHVAMAAAAAERLAAARRAAFTVASRVMGIACHPQYSTVAVAFAVWRVIHVSGQPFVRLAVYLFVKQRARIHFTHFLPAIFA